MSLAVKFRELATVIADRSNPLLVRHVRQELRSRAFIGVFVLILIAAAIAGLWVARMGSGLDEGRSGRFLFAILAGALSFVLWVIQPLGAMRSMVRERDDDTWDLIDLTGMRPMRILLGILLAIQVQGLLYASAIAPFMVMAWLLRGLDLLTVVLMLVMIGLGGILLSACGLFFGCLGSLRSTRSLLLTLLAIGVIGFWFAMQGGFSEFMRYAGPQLSQELLDNPGEVWALFGFLLNAWLAAVVVLLVLASALLTFRADNRSTGPRLVWWLVALNALAWALPFGWVIEEFTEVLATWAVMVLIWALPLGFFAASEEPVLSPRQARAITAVRGWRRWTSWYLGPGRARGRVCYLMLAGLAASVAIICSIKLDHGNYNEVLLPVLMLNGYLAAMALAADLVVTTVGRDWRLLYPRRQILLCLISALIVLHLFLSLGWDRHPAPLDVLSPVGAAMLVGDGYSRFRPGAEVATVMAWTVAIGGAVGLLISALCDWPIRTLRVAARADDRNPRGA